MKKRIICIQHKMTALDKKSSTFDLFSVLDIHGFISFRNAIKSCNFDDLLNLTSDHI